MSKIMNVSGHPIDLDSGRTLAPGEVADGVDLKHPHNSSLLNQGLATEIEVEKKPKAAAAAEPTTATGEETKS